MNPFISAIPWYGWLTLSLVPPLILLLYFLKLRRTPVEVPSTYLWTRTIEDLHVNSIWQRLRNSLLLLLQLLLAFLLLLACLQPGCEGNNIVGERFIFLVDQSASMSATDVKDGMSRLDYAKDQIRNMIDSMDPSASAMIISFSNEADVVQSYTQNKSLLKRKLSSISQTQRSSDMTEALTAASGLANPGRTSDKESSVDIQVADALSAKMFIFSDGGVAQIPDFSLGNLSAEYRPVGSPDIPKNIGITAFSISSDMDTQSGVQAFVRLQNSDDEDHTVRVTLYADGEVFDAQDGISVPKEANAVMSFNLTALLVNFDEAIQVEVRIEDEDVYPIDNVAYGVIEPPRKVDVLVVTPSNKFLELAMGTDRIKKLSNVVFQPPRFLEDKKYQEQVALGQFDLIIYDRCHPERMPDCNTLFFGATPPGDGWKIGDKQFPTVVIDTAVTHPLMDAVQMGAVKIVEGTPLEGPKGTINLVDATYGTVMAIAPRTGFEDLVVGFNLLEQDENGDTFVNSDWPNKLSFPLFVQNALSWLGGAAKFDSSSGTSPGDLIQFRSRVPTQSVSIAPPLGTSVTLRPRTDNTYVYAGANQTGIYRVEDVANNTLDQLLAVNLLDTRESNLAVRDDLEIGYEELQGKSTVVPKRQEYWTWVILTALAILLLEWYIYNRRVFI